MIFEELRYKSDKQTEQDAVQSDAMGTELVVSVVLDPQNLG
ncbi:TPA: hypothetical protein ACPJ1X_002684 [Vibrio alginolyticus]|nr:MULTISPECIES: hypothetical protein [Vibrio]MDW1798030.1 hypothetical protein [Vibrio sp. Vb2297]MDW1808665.1 hypothetical protein [Vibrio sp. Vb2362]MDW1820955.1 hypothetical protein [Vibrio sp. Vb1018]MDW2008154.1 hypothetical protein [Vibrio sp. 431]